MRQIRANANEMPDAWRTLIGWMSNPTIIAGINGIEVETGHFCRGNAIAQRKGAVS